MIDKVNIETRENHFNMLHVFSIWRQTKYIWVCLFAIEHGYVIRY